MARFSSLVAPVDACKATPQMLSSNLTLHEGLQVHPCATQGQVLVQRFAEPVQGFAAPLPWVLLINAVAKNHSPGWSMSCSLEARDEDGG